MKVKLIRAARIRHDAGEIVEVSPAEAGFLLSTGSAVPYTEPVKKEKPETPEDKKKKETPEAETEKPETPEAKNKPKSTRTRK